PTRRSSDLVERPERAEIDARLDQRAVQVQQSDKPRELPAPVADGQDRPAVRLQPGEDMMRVLPRADRDDQWRIRIDVPEDLHPVLLAGDEAMTQIRIHRVPPAHVDANLPAGGGESFLELSLRRPARRVGGVAQVPAGYENHFPGLPVGHGRAPP